jgi:hypothetical protein
MTPSHINPQEMYLLERYISLDYFSELRDTWGMMVSHVESCLQLFMQNIPLDYRSRKVPEQPDVVWGEHVLPNFRDTLQHLNTGFIMLSHGDYDGLKYCHGPSNDFRGQREFWSGWMTESQRSEYFRLLGKSDALATNIIRTEGRYWDPTDLTTRCDPKGRGLLEQPEHWPVYILNQSVSVPSGTRVAKAGVYVSDLDSSCAQFLNSKIDAPLGKVLVEVRDLFSPISGQKYDQELVIKTEACAWYSVERTSEIRRLHAEPPTTIAILNRTEAGYPCKETGYYFTPSRADSRRHFSRGELMPDCANGYGTTIWQWDANQD